MKSLLSRLCFAVAVALAVGSLTTPAEAVERGWPRPDHFKVARPRPAPPVVRYRAFRSYTPSVVPYWTGGYYGYGGYYNGYYGGYYGNGYYASPRVYSRQIAPGVYYNF